MSGSISYITSLFSSTFGSGDPILNALYGGQSGGSSGSPVQALASAEQNQTQDIAATAAQPAVKNAMAAFTKAVTSAKSVTQLLANPAFMNVLLTASGMKDQIGYTALATKALTSNLSDPKSLANQLTDPRWKTVAGTYNFATVGLKTIQTPSTIATITAAYAKATWQGSEDAVTPGLSNALSFRANASTFKTVDAILGDPTARTVVTTALGIPQQIAFQSLNAQEKAISTRLDVAKLQDPKFVETLIQQYLIANSSNASTSSSSPDLTTLAVRSQGILA